ncbi:MAG TPA: bifunctional DNA-binding transcriptional regulator/O6-methylguanine-DNA methyltransferase Ada [Stellaceae bacterium]|nr:bifunctional DNA-binding transcriptional regulator/O6-methylguanine-DNA methyltransferase Ada [Stellaceae bacterium]
MSSDGMVEMMTEDQCWHAVQERARAADGSFVFAVRTTRVYCRPSCPSRRPLRANVEFFPLPEAAERAGYRACRRCRPRDLSAGDPTVDRVRRACRLIERALEEGEGGAPSLAELAEQLDTSPFHLQRLFKRHLGISPRDYADAWRLGRVKRMLRAGDGVAGALYEAGYGSASRLYERADTQLGMTPATYKKGGKGAEIAFTVVASPFGRLLIATTRRGICAISLGESDEALEAALRAEYPAAMVRREDARLRPAVTAVLAHLAGTEPDLALPLDLRATGFEWQVWQALRRIPRGRTASYQEIAAAIGRPKAVRAVANACAHNRVALAIPCHRAVRSDGGIGGYRWGAERKQKLLAAEKAVPAGRRG